MSKRSIQPFVVNVDLQEVQTEDIRAYLLHHGWRAVDAVRGPLSAPRQPDPRVAYFFHEESEAVLMLPIDTGLSDFYPRLREAIERLAHVEECSAYDVVQQFLAQETKRSWPCTLPGYKASVIYPGSLTGKRGQTIQEVEPFEGCITSVMIWDHHDKPAHVVWFTSSQKGLHLKLHEALLAGIVWNYQLEVDDGAGTAAEYQERGQA